MHSEIRMSNGEKERRLWAKAAEMPKSKEGVPIMSGDEAPPDKWQPRAERKRSSETSPLKEQGLTMLEKIQSADSRLRLLKAQIIGTRSRLEDIRKGGGYSDLEIKVNEEELNALQRDMEDWEKFRGNLLKENRQEKGGGNYAFA